MTWGNWNIYSFIEYNTYSTGAKDHSEAVIVAQLAYLISLSKFAIA